MSKLHEVAAMGQSIWLDDLRRALVTTGELRRLLEQDAVTGVTSNPTIFAKAISGSTDYDEQLRALVERGADVDELYVALVTDDIRGACDVFRETWERSETRDGWASVEVSPAIAFDTDATVAEVHEWVKHVDRDNLFVKVPATAPGVPAIERLTAEGISINVTLIFSLERYREVAEAYISGLEGFVAGGGDPSRVHSVASFFVSRVDVEVDRRLEELAEGAPQETVRRIDRLKGRAGIANARVAYGIFLDLFNASRWDALRQRGARPQRPLWASTGVKDPSYRDTMYVEELIAPETINTMPEATIRAFQDHGDPGAGPFTGEQVSEGKQILDELRDVGIDYRDVTEGALEREGVEKFEESFDDLVQCLESKRDALATRRRSWSISGVAVDPPADLAARVWTKDASAWAQGEDDPAQRLGWLTLPEVMEGAIPKLENFTTRVIEAGIQTVVLLGMGGSSLAPEVFAATFGSAGGHPDLVVLDSTHPAQVRAVSDALDLDHTLFLVSSKSGGTVETMSLYRHFRSLVDDGDRFVAITDPGTSLEKLADEEGFRATFTNPPDIGGRYSALSYFGLLPAALIGVDLAGLLSSAQEMAHACERCVPKSHNPGLVVGSALAELAQRGRDKLTFVFSEGLAPFGGWVEQLIAESTGKAGTGIVPVVGEPTTDPTTYGADRVFAHLRLGGDGSHDVFIDAVGSVGYPIITLRAEGAIALGAQIFLWEFATAIASARLGINAFDQPDVEAAKRAARDLLESEDPIYLPEQDPEELFASFGPGELAAVLAFAPRSDHAEEVLGAARKRLVSRYGVATLSGFGPRYLHSTGQLLKGGPSGIRALVVLDPPQEKLEIPGSRHGFDRLVAAQAVGDARALEAGGRRVATTTWDRFEAWTRS